MIHTEETCVPRINTRVAKKEKWQEKSRGRGRQAGGGAPAKVIHVFPFYVSDI